MALQHLHVTPYRILTHSDLTDPRDFLGDIFASIARVSPTVTTTDPSATPVKFSVDSITLHLGVIGDLVPHLDRIMTLIQQSNIKRFVSQPTP